MLIKSPYATTYGKRINTENTIKELVRFIATTDDTNLNYEYKIESDIKLIIIIGYSDLERALPIWDHPLYFKDINGNDTVAVDLRKYVKPTKERPLNIFEIVKDISNVNFVMLRTIITCDFIAGNLGNFRNYYKNIASGFSLVMSNIVNSIIALNPIDKLYVEIVISHYVNIMLTDTDNVKEMLPAIAARITGSKLSLPTNIKTVTGILDILNSDIKNIDDLVSNIKLVLPAEKQYAVDTNVIVNMLSNIWYGPGGSETMIMALEHMPTWITLLYVAIEDKTFKRSRLSTMIDKYSKQIQTGEYEKGIALYLKEHKIN